MKITKINIDKAMTKAIGWFILSLTLMDQNLFGHSDGHGPKIEGIGPNGGVLAAVVLASQAEEKSVATVQYIAELVTKGGRMRLRLLDKATRLELPLRPELAKIILLSSKPPLVFMATPMTGGALIPFEFKLDDDQKMEIIWTLPEGKLVSLFSI